MSKCLKSTCNWTSNPGRYQQQQWLAVAGRWCPIFSSSARVREEGGRRAARFSLP